MLKRKFSALFVGLFCFVGGSAVTNIAANESVYAYELAEYPTSVLSVNGNTASCISYVTCGRTESIEVTQTLQRYSGGRYGWKDVQNSVESKSVEGGSLSFSRSIYELPAGEYRLKSDFVLKCADGTTEAVSITTNSELIVRDPSPYLAPSPQEPTKYGEYIPQRHPTDTVAGLVDFAFDNTKCTVTNLSSKTRRMAAVFMVYDVTGEYVTSASVSVVGGYGESAVAEIPDEIYSSGRYHYRWLGTLYNGELPSSGVAISFDRP